jgi:hypothetical protein
MNTGKSIAFFYTGNKLSEEGIILKAISSQ